MMYLYVVVGVVVLWVVLAYNRFVRLRYRVKESWSDIEVQLKRRYDLIPNLIETVKGYMAHERGVFEKVTQARTAAMGAQTAGEHAQTENMLSGALKSLFAVAENYPELKANTNFLELQKELWLFQRQKVLGQAHFFLIPSVLILQILKSPQL